MEFETLDELYRRVRPALQSKLQELYRVGYLYIKEEDVWNALRDTKWKNTRNLCLSEMVNDILNVDNHIIDDYCKKQMEMMKRTPNLFQEETV